MPSSGKYEQCSKGETEEYLRYFENRFGIPRRVFRGLSFLKRGKNIWIFSGDLGVVSETERIETVGIKAISISRKAVKPTTAFIQAFGKHATKNVVDLKNEEEMIEFMTGGVIKRKFNVSKGYVIVKFGDDVLGCGLYTDLGLISQIPKARRVDKRWFEVNEPE